MEWNELKSSEQVEQIIAESKLLPVLIFKYSSRCSISRVALDRLERQWDAEAPGNPKPYFLDLLSHRDTSHNVARRFNVEHESPQVILVEGGKSVYDESHFGIDYGQILEASRRGQG